MVGGIENEGEPMPRTRKSHPPSLKAKVAVEAIKGHKTTAQIAQMFVVHPTQVGGLEETGAGRLTGYLRQRLRADPRPGRSGSSGDVPERGSRGQASPGRNCESEGVVAMSPPEQHTPADGHSSNRRNDPALNLDQDPHHGRPQFGGRRGRFREHMPAARSPRGIATQRDGYAGTGSRKGWSRGASNGAEIVQRRHPMRVGDALHRRYTLWRAIDFVRSSQTRHSDFN